MAGKGNGKPGDTLEILRIRGDDNVHVLRPPDDAPGIDGKTTDQAKLHPRFREPAKKLIESWFGQLLSCAVESSPQPQVVRPVWL